MENSKCLVRRIDCPHTAERAATPFQAKDIRALSLENHLALAAMRFGHGNQDHLSRLARTVHLAFFLQNMMRPNEDIEPYRRAEAALNACAARVERGARCLLLDRELMLIDYILAVHDEQLTATTRCRCLATWERLQSHIAASQR